MNCEYDCYQITLQVDISVADSCIFDRYGQSVFSIKPVDRRGPVGADCGCGPKPFGPYPGEFPDPNFDPIPTEIIPTIYMPHAVILDVTIDRCNCTRALFNLYVRLPCKNSISYDSFNIPVIESSSASAAAGSEAAGLAAMAYNGTFTTTTTMNSGMADPAIVYPNYPTTIPPTPVKVPTYIIDALMDASANIPILVNDLITELTSPSVDCSVLNSIITALNTLITELQADIAALPASFLAYEDNATIIKNLSISLKILYEAINVPNLNPNQPMKFASTKFAIISGTSGRDRVLTTILVNPLKNNVISTGVVDKCAKYDITRVPMRQFITTTNDSITYAVCQGNKLITIGNDCFRTCCPGIESLDYAPNTLQITFPLTKELKCLLPDFNLPGTYFNTVEGIQPTLVKIQSSCPRKYSFPALMTFDKVNCNVCLEIDQGFISNIAAGGNRLNGFEQVFGCNCANLFSSVYDRCCREGHFQLELANTDNFFSFLSSSRKFDVFGVQKCVEKIFFSFQICEVPYKPFCVEACGCKTVTVIPSTIPPLPSTSFRVESLSPPFTYEFFRKRCPM